jgi:hypothetical protein
VKSVIENYPGFGGALFTGLNIDGVNSITISTTDTTGYLDPNTGKPIVAGSFTSPGAFVDQIKVSNFQAAPEIDPASALTCAHPTLGEPGSVERKGFGRSIADGGRTPLYFGGLAPERVAAATQRWWKTMVTSRGVTRPDVISCADSGSSSLVRPSPDATPLPATYQLFERRHVAISS